MQSSLSHFPDKENFANQTPYVHERVQSSKWKLFGVIWSNVVYTYKSTYVQNREKKICALFHQHIAGHELVFTFRYYYGKRKREVYKIRTGYTLVDSTMLNAVGKLFMKFQFHIGWIIIKKNVLTLSDIKLSSISLCGRRDVLLYTL